MPVEPKFKNVRRMTAQMAVASAAAQQFPIIYTAVNRCCVGQVSVGVVLGPNFLGAWAGQIGTIGLRIWDPATFTFECYQSASSFGQDSEYNAAAAAMQFRDKSFFAPVSVEFGWFDMAPGMQLQLVCVNNTGGQQLFSASFELDEPIGVDNTRYDVFPGGKERGLECLLSSHGWDDA